MADQSSPLPTPPFEINPAFLKACTDLHQAFVDAVPAVSGALLFEVAKLLEQARHDSATPPKAALLLPNALEEIE